MMTDTKSITNNPSPMVTNPLSNTNSEFINVNSMYIDHNDSRVVIVFNQSIFITDRNPS